MAARPTALDARLGHDGDVVGRRPRRHERRVAGRVAVQRPHDPLVATGLGDHPLGHGRGAVGGAREDEHDVLAVADALHGRVVGPPLRLRVRVAGGVGVGPGPLGDRRRAGVEEGRAADGHDPSHAGAPGGVEHDLGTEHVHRFVGGDVLGRPARRRSRVHDDLAAVDGRGDRSGVGEVAPHDDDADGLERRGVGRRSHQRPHLVAGGHEPLGDPRADEAGGPGDDDLRHAREALRQGAACQAGAVPSARHGPQDEQLHAPALLRPVG